VGAAYGFILAEQQATIVASAQDWGKANVQGQNKITDNVTGDTVADRVATSGASDKTQRDADYFEGAVTKWLHLVLRV